MRQAFAAVDQLFDCDVHRVRRERARPTSALRSDRKGSAAARRTARTAASACTAARVAPVAPRTSYAGTAPVSDPFRGGSRAASLRPRRPRAPPSVFLRARSGAVRDLPDRARRANRAAAAASSRRLALLRIAPPARRRVAALLLRRRAQARGVAREISLQFVARKWLRRRTLSALHFRAAAAAASCASAAASSTASTQ